MIAALDKQPASAGSEQARSMEGHRVSGAVLLTSLTPLYDAVGNPTSYLGQTLTWEGKQLTAAGTTTYEYDENGLRLNKTVNNVSTDYYYNGSVLMSLVTGNDTLLFSYDASGKVVAVNCNGTYYYYLRNGQGDIVKLIDNSGATVVEYTYDTWGKQLSCTGSLASTLGTLNPFRYRGYVYDEETQWYYLQSRYYDPTTGRFISADILLSTGQGVLGHNAYAYCGNNPVNRIDDEGEFWNIVIGAVAGAIFGAVIAAVNGGDVKDIIVGALVGSAVGALVGMGVGAAVGAIAGGAAAGTAAAATGGAAVASITTTQAAGLAVAAGAAVVVGTNAAVELAKNNNVHFSKPSINEYFGDKQKKGTPKNNVAQNKQFDAAMKEVGIKDKNIIRQIHYDISHLNYSFKEIVEYARSFVRIK